MKENSQITLRTLTKGNVWDLQENDIFALWHKPEKEDNISERGSHYMDIVRTAFDVEEIKVPKREIIARYEERGMKVGVLYLRGEPTRKERPVEKEKPRRGRNKENQENAIEAEQEYGTRLPEFRDTMLNKAVTASVEDFDAVYDQGMDDYLANGGQAIIDERAASGVEQNGTRLHFFDELPVDHPRVLRRQGKRRIVFFRIR